MMKSLLVVGTLFTTACTTTIDGNSANPANPVGASAPYAVKTTVDLSVEAILPAQAEAAVAGLRTFSTNPGQTLFALAAQAGVPAVSALENAIPSSLQSKLNGFLNDALSNVRIDGKTIQAWSGQVADLADAALSKFTVNSTMTLTNDSATQTLTALDFNRAGLAVVVPVLGLAQDVLTQTAPITVTEGGALGIGDERFGLNYGDYAWDAVNQVVTNELGTDIATTLAKAVNCAGVAKTIANKCVLVVCVGHQQDIEAICTGGLNELVSQVHDQFSAIRTDAFEFASGTATLVDSNGDGIADQLSTGTWDAEMDLGMGLRHTPATFVGQLDIATN